MKLFSLWPKQLVHFACNSPEQEIAGQKKDAAVAASFRGLYQTAYLLTALINAAALSVCSQVKNLKFLSLALRPKWPYWLVKE